MQKLSVEVLEDMMRKKVSNKELEFVLYIARFQDETGRARGIYYKDICGAAGMSFQGFYNCRASLEAKGIIRTEKNDPADCDITILSNSFAGREGFGRGYVSVHAQMVRSEEFRGLKAGAKLMALYLLREWKIFRKKTGRTGYQILRATFLSKFRELLGVSERTVRRYLGTLAPFLQIYLEGGRKYFLTFRERFAEPAHGRDVDSENGELQSHLVRMACRRNRIREAEDAAIRDVKSILSVHWVALSKMPDFDLSAVVRESLEILNQKARNRYRWKRQLKPPLVHKCAMQHF